MKNFKFIISYDGSRYFGWERQPGRDTIQGKLEAVLTRMCGTDVQVIGAGRTDAGVHARAMAANAYMDTEKTPEEIRDYMNRYLPDDICVQEAKLAADRFHARYRAVGKLYTYTCYVGDTKPVFNRKYVTVLDYQPDLAAMQRAAEYLTGEHDYKSFCSNPQMKKSTVRIGRFHRDRPAERLYLFQLPRHGLSAEHGAHPDRNASGGRTGQAHAGERPADARSEGPDAGRVHRASAGAVPDAGGLLTEPAARLKVFCKFAAVPTKLRRIRTAWQILNAKRFCRRY